MTTYAESDKAALEAHLEAVDNWVGMWASDVANLACGAVKYFLDEQLLEIRRIRWYSITSEAELKEIWAKFIQPKAIDGEQAESILDFYITGTSYMQVLCPIATTHYDQFTGHLAKAMVWPKSATVASDLVRQNSANTAEFSQLIKSNPWMVFLIILSILPIKAQSS